MPTINELMEGKEPGAVKVYMKSWAVDEYFVPWFCFDSQWHGIKYDGQNSWTTQWGASSGEWHYWQPAKKLVTRYLWADRITGVTTRQLMTKEELDNWQEIRNLAPFTVRLDWSATEFEVDYDT